MHSSTSFSAISVAIAMASGENAAPVLAAPPDEVVVKLLPVPEIGNYGTY